MVERIKNKKIEKQLQNNLDKEFQKLEKIVKKIKKLGLQKCKNCNKSKYCENGEYEFCEHILDFIHSQFSNSTSARYILSKTIEGGGKVIGLMYNTGSMSPVINVGDLPVISIPNSDLKKGDIVVYQKDGKIVCHYYEKTDKNGVCYFKTTTGCIDKAHINQTIGKILLVIKPQHQVYKYLTYKKDIDEK